jgi:hypothetical protein
VIAGPNAKISATYSKNEFEVDNIDDDSDYNTFIIGAQLQF